MQELGYTSTATARAFERGSPTAPERTEEHAQIPCQSHCACMSHAGFLPLGDVETVTRT